MKKNIRVCIYKRVCTGIFVICMMTRLGRPALQVKCRVPLDARGAGTIGGQKTSTLLGHGNATRTAKRITAQKLAHVGKRPKERHVHADRVPTLGTLCHR